MIQESSGALTDILNVIESADHLDLMEIMNAIQARYTQLFPDYDIAYLALPRKSQEEREAFLNQAVNILKKV